MIVITIINDSNIIIINIIISSSLISVSISISSIGAPRTLT